MILCSMCCGRWDGRRISGCGGRVRHRLRLSVVWESCIRCSGGGRRTLPPWRGVSEVLRVNVEPASGTSRVFGFREPRYQTRSVEDVRARKTDNRSRGSIIKQGVRTLSWMLGSRRSSRIRGSFAILQRFIGQQVVPADCATGYLIVIGFRRVFVCTRDIVNPRHPLH